MIMAMTVFVVGRTQIVSVDVAETQDPFEDAAESELKRRERKEKQSTWRFLILIAVKSANRQDENLRRQRDGARVEHEPDRPPEPDDQLVYEVP